MAPYVIPVRQHSEPLFVLLTPIGASASFPFPVREVAGYDVVNFLAISNLAFQIRVEEASTADGPWTPITAFTSVPVAGLQQVCDRVFPCGRFMRVFLDNLAASPQSTLEFTGYGLPIFGSGGGGLQGPQGTNPGVQGPQGFQGPRGFQGSLGPQGNQGSLGPQGNQGSLGPQGNQGPQAPSGYPPDISARAHLAAPMAANVETPISWDTVDFDTAAFFNLGADPTAITIPETGKYQYGANGVVTANSGNSLRFSVNGVGEAPLVASNDAVDAGVSQIRNFTAGDILRVLYQNAGGGAGTDTSVWIKRVA